MQRLEQKLSEKEQKKAVRKGKDSSATIHELHPENPPPPTESAETDIDRLLDKISEQGYDALTAEEKRRLLNASKK